MLEPKTCETCHSHIDPTNAHPRVKNRCNRCHSKIMQERREEIQERKHTELIAGRWYCAFNSNMVDRNGKRLCPNAQICKNVLTSGTFYPDHPEICKDCFRREGNETPVGTRQCEDCNQAVSLTDYYSNNKRRCKKCQTVRNQGYRAWRDRVMQVERNEH